MNIVLRVKKKKIKQKIFQIINDSMQIKSVTKTQFAGLNDHDGIVSLSFAHFFKIKVREEKEKHQADLHAKV